MNFPEKTKVDKRIAKQKFYENAKITPKLKDFFVNSIKAIYWRNKLSETTMNIAAGERVKEIEFIEILLQKEEIEEKVLYEMDKAIPYHIVFILTCDDRTQIWAGYKELTETSASGKIMQYFHTDWMPTGQVDLPITGFHLDAVYNNLILYIAGNKLTMQDGEMLEDAILRTEQENKVSKEIEKLEKLARAEKQPRRKFEIAEQIQLLKKEIGE